MAETENINAWTRGKIIWPLLLLITAAGFALRFYHWDFQSYWLDELFSASFSHPRMTLGEVIDNARRVDAHPYLYHITLWIWYNLFGHNEFTGRLFSIICGTLIIPAIFFLGREIYNARAGIFCAVITALNYQLIWYAQEARSYSFLVLFTVISTYFLLAAINRYKNSDLLLYLISTIALINIHFFGFLILGVHGLYFIYRTILSQKIQWKLVIAFILILLSIIPFAARMLTLASWPSFWIPEPRLSFFLHYFGWYFNSVYLACLILALAALSPLNKNIRKYYLPLLLMAIFAVWFIPYFASKYVLSINVLIQRFTLILLPFIIITAATGMANLKKLKLQLIPLCLIILLSGYTLVNKGIYHIPQKEGWRETMAYLQDNYNGEPVFTPNLAAQYAIYAEWMNFDLQITEDEKNIRLLPPGARFWMLVRQNSHPNGCLADLNLKQIKSFDLNEAQAILFEKLK